MQGRNSAPTTTADVAIPAASLARDNVDAGMVDKSSMVAVQNRKKRPPCGDAIEVLSGSRLMA
jgi:hypothetical protein